MKATALFLFLLGLMLTATAGVFADSNMPISAFAAAFSGILAISVAGACLGESHANLSQPQHGGLVEAALREAIEWDGLDSEGIPAVWLNQALAALTSSNSPVVGEDAGGQDRKFAFRNGQFVNRVSGEAIPLDEPIIIFRARDRHAEHVLREYLSMATDEHHRQAIRDRMSEFAAYRAAHPERMKEPGITHEIRLNDEAKPTPTDTADLMDTIAADHLAVQSGEVKRRPYSEFRAEVMDKVAADRREAIARAVLDKICAAMCKATGAVAIDPDPWVRELAADIAFLIAGPRDGHVVVPIEPTNEMLHAGSDAAAAFGTPLTRTANAYRAMIAARPGTDA